MKNKFFISFSLIILACFYSGCVHTSIKITDSNGNPIENALVLSEQHPFIFSKHRLSATVSDHNGKATYVGTGASIFKSGYYPDKGSNPKATLYKIVHPNQPKVEISHRKILCSERNNLVKLIQCRDVLSYYSCDDQEFTIVAENKLTTSDNFYFFGPKQSSNSKIKANYRGVTFYCQGHDNTLHKIKLSSFGTWRKKDGKEGAFVDTESAILTAPNETIEPEQGGYSINYKDFHANPYGNFEFHVTPSVSIIRKSIEENMPAETKEQKDSKQSWLNVIFGR